MWLPSEAIIAEITVGMNKYSNCLTMEHSSRHGCYAMTPSKQVKTFQIFVAIRTALP